MKNENFIFPIFIFQLFYTFFGRGNIASHLEARALRVNGRLASMDALLHTISCCHCEHQRWI